MMQLVVPNNVDVVPPIFTSRKKTGQVVLFRTRVCKMAGVIFSSHFRQHLLEYLHVWLQQNDASIDTTTLPPRIVWTFFSPEEMFPIDFLAVAFVTLAPD